MSWGIVPLNSCCSEQIAKSQSNLHLYWQVWRSFLLFLSSKIVNEFTLKKQVQYVLNILSRLTIFMQIWILYYYSIWFIVCFIFLPFYVYDNLWVLWNTLSPKRAFFFSEKQWIALHKKHLDISTFLLNHCSTRIVLKLCPQLLEWFLIFETTLFKHNTF